MAFRGGAFGEFSSERAVIEIRASSLVQIRAPILVDFKVDFFFLGVAFRELWAVGSYVTRSLAIFSLHDCLSSFCLGTGLR